MATIDTCDALFLGPHPDDVEIAASGTILRLTATGRRVSVLDITGGERGSSGNAQERAAEAVAAASQLGLHQRHNLGLPDAGVQVDEASTRLLVAAIRTSRAKLLFAPLDQDVHPDHRAVAELAARAHFLSGLKNYEPDLGAAHRPKLLIRYAGNTPLDPSFCIDISDLVEQKEQVLRCYASQLSPHDRGHLVQGLDILERAQVRDRFHGARIGARAAEAFLVDGPLPLTDLAPLMG
jgi:bacillithiol biosynthesis deacetylase BshB1